MGNDVDAPEKVQARIDLLKGFRLTLSGVDRTRMREDNIKHFGVSVLIVKH